MTDQTQKYEECPQLGSLVTAKKAKLKPIYNWFVYPHSFAPELVWFLFERLKIQPHQRVFDPFVGAGTTILAAKDRQVSGIGLDLLLTLRSEGVK